MNDEKIKKIHKLQNNRDNIKFNLRMNTIEGHAREILLHELELINNDIYNLSHESSK